MNPAVFAPSRPAASGATQGHGMLGWFSDLREHVSAHAGIIAHPSRWTARGWTLAALTVVYAVLTALVVVPGTFLQTFDLWIVDRHFGGHHASWLWWVKIIVGFGQRWIVTYILQVVFLIACFRARSIRPMVYFVTSLILINGTVGIVKTAIGRIGPFKQSNADISAHRIFIIGGDIYPSGHVSNAVVMFGVLAFAIPRFRRALIVLVVAASIGVGLGTLFMRTHWASDVMGGWVAGAIVLLLLPTVMPWTERLADQIVDVIRESVRTRPTLHRRCHAVLDWGLRVIPAEEHYWDGPSRRAARRRGRHRARADQLATAMPVIEQLPAVEEFDTWPTTDPRSDEPGRERTSV